MSRDEARAHVRAAQEAELAGNKPAAVGHLERAALEFVRNGQPARAVQMYQHCLRLTPERPDLRDALAKAESWTAARTSQPPQLAALPGSDGFDALAIPRGPTRSIEGLEAWCSFCCRPTREVGALIAGPAGAFICGACLTAAAELLGARVPSIAPVQPEPPRESSWLGPKAILELARAALQGRGPSIVVVGPEGSGKSALLEALASEFPRVARVDLALGEPISASSAPLLLDHVEREEGALPPLGRPFVAALRAEAELQPLELQVNDARLALPLAPGVTLPPALAEAVTLGLAAPDEALLGLLLERALTEPGAPTLSEGLREVLIARALASGRGGRGLRLELRALGALGPEGVVMEKVDGVRRRRRRKT